MFKKASTASCYVSKTEKNPRLLLGYHIEHFCSFVNKELITGINSLDIVFYLCYKLGLIHDTKFRGNCREMQMF